DHRQKESSRPRGWRSYQNSRWRGQPASSLFRQRLQSNERVLLPLPPLPFSGILFSISCIGGIKETKVIPFPSYHYKCQHANKTSLDEAAGSSKSFPVVVGKDVGFHHTQGCGCVNESDVVARPAFGDETNMSNLILFSACGKKHKVSRAQLIKFHFLPYLALID